MLYSQATSLATGRTTSIASPSAAGRHVLSTAAVRASGGSDSTFRGLQIKWWGRRLIVDRALEEAHWDVIPRCRKIASMRPSCI
ncbi:hypothetical protein EVAR_68965_1 [Eumeta japonica]|uniref:Uncharacterized protein n=1 Tax=Eumeta variegata TaxID=151549 RepID=A0A4C2A2C3_EUMVA|nr:hypothetical protein EVAR_68965_1 [Eumeta japonica]